MRRIAALAVVLMAIALTGWWLTAPRDDYFRKLGGAFSSTGPISTGTTMLVGGLDITANEGDTITLVDAVGLGSSGVVPVEPYVLVVGEGDSVGVMRPGDKFRDGSLVQDRLKPLRGFVFTAATGRVQIVLGVTRSAPATVWWTHTRLTYLVGDRAGAQTWAAGGGACIDTPAPTACDVPELD